MKMQEGEYFIGDPCYVIKDELWSEFCDNLWEAENEPGFLGVMNFKGVRLFVSNTAHGDGCYEDQYGNSYPVDAGLIGATYLDPAIIKEDTDEYSGLGVIVELKENFTCYTVDEDGCITIGKFEIDTDPSYDDEDYSDEW